MALTFTQRKTYTSTIKVYRVADRTPDALGEVPDETWAAVAGLSSVPALLGYTQDDSDPTGVGRVKRRSALTEDRLYVEVDKDIRDQDLIVDVTPGVPTYGNVYRIMGQPTTMPTAGGRPTNERLYQIFQEEKFPAEVIP